jgi:hypothetical protein
MNSAAIARPLQLGRPYAAPQLPATAEAASLTPPLSHSPQQDPLAKTLRLAAAG